MPHGCNLRCVYCYGDGGSYGNEGEMDPKTARKAVDWLIGQSQMLSKLSITFFCSAGRRYVAVSSAGDIYLCHRFVGTEAYRLGSVFDGALKRDPYLKSSLRFVQKCRECFAKYVCSGGCYYDNLTANGSVFEPDEERCRLARRSVELIASLTCRLSPEDKDYLTKEGIVPTRPCPFDL